MLTFRRTAKASYSGPAAILVELTTQRLPTLPVCLDHALVVAFALPCLYCAFVYLDCAAPVRLGLSALPGNLCWYSFAIQATQGGLSQLPDVTIVMTIGAVGAAGGW